MGVVKKIVNRAHCILRKQQDSMSTPSYILNIISDNSLLIFEGGMSWEVPHFLVRAKLKF